MRTKLNYTTYTNNRCLLAKPGHENGIWHGFIFKSLRSSNLIDNWNQAPIDNHKQQYSVNKSLTTSWDNKSSNYGLWKQIWNKRMSLHMFLTKLLKLLATHPLHNKSYPCKRLLVTSLNHSLQSKPFECHCAFFVVLGIPAGAELSLGHLKEPATSFHNKLLQFAHPMKSEILLWIILSPAKKNCKKRCKTARGFRIHYCLWKLLHTIENSKQKNWGKWDGCHGRRP